MTPVLAHASLEQALSLNSTAVLVQAVPDWSSKESA